jgi:hypothetical protein
MDTHHEILDSRGDKGDTTIFNTSSKVELIASF